MIKTLNLYCDLRKVQTLLNCMEGTMIRATADNMNDAALESFDLSAPFENVDFRRNGVSFLTGQHTGVIQP